MHVEQFNIGIKRVFLCIKSAGPWEWCWNLSLKGRGFNDPQGVLADVVVSENHIWSLLLYKVILSLKNASKISFLSFYKGAQKHEGLVGFENACYRGKTYVILTSLNYINFYICYTWLHQFCDGLEYVYLQYKSRASTACFCLIWFFTSHQQLFS